jgi:hypothetical protein
MVVVVVVVDGVAASDLEFTYRRGLEVRLNLSRHLADNPISGLLGVCMYINTSFSSGLYSFFTRTGTTRARRGGY